MLVTLTLRIPYFSKIVNSSYRTQYALTNSIYTPKPEPNKAKHAEHRAAILFNMFSSCFYGPYRETRVKRQGVTYMSLDWGFSLITRNCAKEVKTVPLTSYILSSIQLTPNVHDVA
jgi:hypothetical protein